MSYEGARGAWVWRPGDPLPEKVIGRIRGDHSECEATIAQLRRQVSLDLAKMADMAGSLRETKDFLMRQRPPRAYGVIQRIDNALYSAPTVLFSRKAELRNGMLCGYLRGDPRERIDAPDQCVRLMLLVEQEEGRDDTEDLYRVQEANH